MKRALVLGGGGSVGIAWETGLLSGLMNGGLDAREADLIIGTSAGAFVGAHLAHRTDARELRRRQRDEPPSNLAEGAQPQFDQQSLVAVFQLWGAAERMTDERCAQIGQIAANAKTMAEEQWLAGYERQGWAGWPQQPFIATAVDCESGVLKAFDAGSGAPIERAVAASCAVPGMFPPVEIGGRRYTDGGVRSLSNADLAQRIEPDKVLIISVFGFQDRGVHALANRQLAEEKGALESAGAKVEILRFDEAAVAAGATNLMDPASRGPAADAGEAHGRRVAPELKAWWDRT